MSYATVQQRRANFGSGLVALHRSLGVRLSLCRPHFVPADPPQVSDSQQAVGLWSTNRPEWQIVDLGLMSQSLYSVSIYDTLGPQTAEYITNHASLPTIVCAVQHVPTLLTMAERIPGVKLIVSLDPLAAPGEPGEKSKQALLGAWAASKNIKLVSISDVEALGAAHPLPYAPPRPDHPVTINYTSGTTGNPKGVLLTHANAVAAVTGALCSSMSTRPNDVQISYLPLAHIFARLAESTLMWGGAAIAYFHGNMLELTQDIQAARPTALISVPRVYNRIAAGLKAATVDAMGARGAISRHVVNAKMATLQTSGSNQHAFYDRAWASKVKRALGLERCNAMISGSAPISPDVLQFLRVVFANNFVEGYGMTETYSCLCSQLAQDNSAGNVGPPTPVTECRLRDVPAMGYTAADTPRPRGEMLVRGPMLFAGYFRQPEIDAEVFDDDGWFATGDICEVDELGRFCIIDRIKNLLKLAQGEYVSPEKVENQYLAQTNLFAQAFVHGDSFQSFLVAIFGVDRVPFAAFASNVLGKKIDPQDDKAVLAACKAEKVRKAALKELDRAAKKADLVGFERVRNVHLCIDPFTMENELLTPT